jgi:preprotein translocase subunit YajC
LDNKTKNTLEVFMNFFTSLLLFAAETAVDPNASGADLDLPSAGNQVAPGGNWVSLLIIIVPLVLMYFLAILPQKKREKQLQDTINNAIVGDQIVTIGGISGKIVNIKDDEITFETSVERTKMTIKKWSVKEVIKPISE